MAVFDIFFSSRSNGWCAMSNLSEIDNPLLGVPEEYDDEEVATACCCCILFVPLVVAIFGGVLYFIHLLFQLG